MRETERDESDSVKRHLRGRHLSVLNLEFDFISDGGRTREEQIALSLKRHLFPHGSREPKAFWICFSRVHPLSEIKSKFKFKTLKRHLLKWHLTLSETSPRCLSTITAQNYYKENALQKNCFGTLILYGPGSVRFGYGLGVERFDRFRFSVSAVPLQKGLFFSVFPYSLTGKDGSGSGFSSWKTLPAVPVRLSVSGKMVPTVPVPGSGSVPEPPCFWEGDATKHFSLDRENCPCTQGVLPKGGLKRDFLEVAFSSSFLGILASDAF